MTDVTPFTFPEDGRDIRVLSIDGEPWFFGSDVAGSLGYVNPNKAITQHVDDEDRSTSPVRDGAPGGPDRLIINESGLYALIFGSKLPAAKAFKRWVTSEVLPTIRRTGSYTLKPRSDLDAIRDALDAIEADRARIAAVEDRTTVVESQLAGVLGHYDEFTALGYAKLRNLDTSRSYLSRLGRMASKISRERGAEPRTRQDVSFGEVKVYPVDVLDEAVGRLS